MILQKKKFIASIVSLSMMFSMIAPNLVLANNDLSPSEPTIVEVEPSDEETPENPVEPAESEEEEKNIEDPTEETADPTDASVNGDSDSEQSNKDDGELSETSTQDEKITEPEEENKGDDDKETEETTAPETESTEETDPVVETDPVEETKPEEPETPDKGKKAAPGLKAAPTRGEVEVQPGGVSSTAEAGLDACAMLYYASSTDTDHYVLEIQEGNQYKSTSYGEFIKSYVIGTDDIPWNEDYNDATGELYKTNIIRVNYRQNFTGRTSLSHFYDDFTNLTQITNYDKIYTVDVTDFSYMYHNCSNLTSGYSGSNFYTTNGTDFSYMFSGCKIGNSFSYDTTKWNTSNGTNFSHMFEGTSLTTINLNGFEFDSAEKVNYMVYGNPNMTSLTIEGANLRNADDLNNFIVGNSSITSIKAKNLVWPDQFDINTDGANVFNGNGTSGSLDATGWSNLPESFDNLFGRRWQSFKTITTTNWDLTGVKSLLGAFTSDNITTINGTNSWLNATSLENVSQLFYGTKCSSYPVSTSLANSPLKDTSMMFMNCSNVTTLDVGTLDMSAVENATCMFYGCTKLTKIGGSNGIVNLSTWNTSNVTDMGAMFYECTALTNVNMSGLDTSNVISFGGMFFGCTNLTTVNLSGFVFDESADVSGMFVNDTKITTLNLTNATVPSTIGEGNGIGINTTNLLANGHAAIGNDDNVLKEAGLYEKVNKTLYLNYNGGTDPNYMPEAIYITASHTTAEVLPQPTKDGLVFGGWYKDYSSNPNSNLANFEIFANTVLTNNSNYPAGTTFYAHYANPGTRFGVIGRGTGSWNAGNVYTIAYDSGVAVVQRGTTPDPQYGNVVSTNMSSQTNLVNVETDYKHDTCTKIIFKDTIDNFTTMDSCFANFYKVTEIVGLGNLNTENVTDWDSCFMEMHSLETLDLRGLKMNSNTSNYSFIGSWDKEDNKITKIILGETNKFVNSTSSQYNPDSTIDQRNEWCPGGWIHGDIRYTNPFNNYTPARAGEYVLAYQFTFYTMGGRMTGDSVKYYTPDGGFIDGTTTFEIPTKSGQTFLGWFDKDGIERTSFDPTTDDFDYVYAKWQAGSWTLVLKPNGADADDIVVEVPVDEVYNLTNVFTRSGYKLTGWRVNSNGTGAGYSANAILGSNGAPVEEGETLTLYAQWIQLEEVEITYHFISLYDGSTLFPDKTYTLETGTSLADTTTEINQADYGDYFRLYILTSDGCDYLHWNLITDPSGNEGRDGIYYRQGGGDDYATNESYSYVYNCFYDYLNYPSQGVVTADMDGADYYVYLLPKPTGTLYFSKEMLEQDPGVRFVIDGVEYESGEFSFSYNPPTSFWSTGDSYEQFINYMNYINSNNIYYDLIDQYGAIKTNRGYYVYYNMGPNTCALEDNFFIPTQVVDGMQFYQPNGSSSIPPYYTRSRNIFEHDLALYLNFVGQIHFDANGGQFSDGTTEKDRSPIQFGANSNIDLHHQAIENQSYQPTTAIYGSNFFGLHRDGYIFDGFWTEPEGGEMLEYEQIGSNYYVFADLTKTYYAHWTVEPEKVFVTVSFDSDGGSAVGDCVLEAGQPLPVYPTPTKDNFNFVGWYTEDGRKWDSTTPVLTDMTLYAHWTEGTVTITWDAGDGSHPTWNEATRPSTGNYNAHTNAMLVPVGAPISVLPGTSWANHRFMGWFTEPNGQGTQIHANTVATEDVIYYAYWTDLLKSVELSDISYNYHVEFTNASTSLLSASTNSLVYIQDKMGSNMPNPVLHIFFDVNLEEGTSIPAGSISIKVPYSIWNMQGYSVSNWGNLPQYPTVADGMFFSYEPHIVNDDHGWPIPEESYYLLINTVPLTGGTGLDASITYEFSPDAMHGGDIINGELVNGKTPFTRSETQVELIYDSGSGNKVTLETDDFVAEYHSHLELDPTACSIYGTGTFVWNDSWGPKPDDADKYFYVTWQGSLGTLGQDTSTTFTLENTSSVEPEGEFVKVLGTNPNGRSYLNGRTTNLYTGSVLYRYPISMVDPESETATVHLNAEIWLHPEDSFDSYLPVSGSGTVRWNVQHFDKAPFNITRLGNRVVEKQVPIATGKQYSFSRSDVGNKDFWSIGYEDMAPYHVDLNTGLIVYDTWGIEMGQAQGDWVYSSGVGDKFYQWQPPTGNTVLYHDSFSIEYLTISGRHYDTINVESEDIRYGERRYSYDPVVVDVYILLAGYGYVPMDQVILDNSNGFAVTWQVPSSGGPMFDYADVLGYKVRSSTSGHFMTQLTVKPQMTFRFNQAIKNKMLIDIAQDVSSCIKADASFARSLNGGEWVSAQKFLDMDDASASYNLYELTKLHTDQDYNINTTVYGPTQNPADQTQTEQVNIIAHHATTNTDESYEITSGTFSVLLPKDLSISNIHLTRFAGTSNSPTGTSNSREIDPQYFSYEIESNYNNTDMQLLTVTFSVPVGTNHTSSTANHVRLTFDATRTNNDIFVYSRDVDIYAMFEDSTVVIPNYRYISLRYDAFSKNYLFDDLYDATKDGRTVFTSLNYYYNTVTAFTWGYNGYVAEEGGIYGTDIELFPGEKYNYKLIYGQSSDAKVNEIKLVDTLDGIGKLVDVEAPVLHGEDEFGVDVTATPVILYNLNENPDFENIDTEHGWTTTMPVGQVCTAISFDYSKADNGNDFRYNDQHVFEIVIHQDLDDFLGEGQFENRSDLVVNRYTSLEADTHVSYHSTSDLNINLPDLEIHKSSNPVSGTVDAPTRVEVGDEITYTISVTNNEDKDISDIIVSDPINQNLVYSVNNIKVGSLKIGEDTPNFEIITSTEELVQIKIKTLQAGSTVTFTIKAKVQSGGSNTITNTSYIVGYNDVALNNFVSRYTSETTYHEYSSMPEPTGLVTTMTVYVIVFSCISVVYVLSKKRKKRTY